MPAPEPTEWSIDIATIIKKDKVRICLDQTELNKVLLHENYLMPTLEDVAPRLAGAKFFFRSGHSIGFLANQTRI